MDKAYNMLLMVNVDKIWTCFFENDKLWDRKS